MEAALETAMEEIRTRYTHPGAMHDYLVCRKPAPALYRACRMLEIARDPQGRYGLTAADCAATAAALPEMIAELRAAVAPAVARVREMVDAGRAADEIASEMRGLRYAHLGCNEIGIGALLRCAGVG